MPVTRRGRGRSRLGPGETVSNEAFGYLSRDKFGGESISEEIKKKTAGCYQPVMTREEVKHTGGISPPSPG
jgi:hypothetical protein